MQIFEVFSSDVPRGLVPATDEDYDRIDALLGTPVGEKWFPPRLSIEEYESSSADFSLRDIGLWPTGEPLLSKRAQEVMKDILDPWIELLPTLAPDGQCWYLCNLTRRLDALDVEHSEILRWPRSHIVRYPRPDDIRTILKYVFHDEMLQGVSLFRIPQRPIQVFATDRFVKRVRDAELTGVIFKTPDERDSRIAGPQRRLPG